jgi:hypothetical protein
MKEFSQAEKIVKRVRCGAAAIQFALAKRKRARWCRTRFAWIQLEGR